VIGYEVRLVLAAVLAGALAWAGWTINGWRVAAKENAAALSQADATAGATEATTGALSGVVTETQRVEVVVTQGRAAAAQAVQELSNADPTVRDLRALPIHPGMRDIARQRREARDRPAGATPGGSGPDRAPEPGG
jgi:hypothetical protein